MGILDIGLWHSYICRIAVCGAGEEYYNCHSVKKTALVNGFRTILGFYGSEVHAGDL
jgi:hypothetical protein